MDGIQICNVYIPTIWPRTKRLSDYHSQLMSDTCLPNGNIGWALTSNCTISKNGDIGFMVRVLRQRTLTSAKGTRKSSTFFKTVTEA